MDRGGGEDSERPSQGGGAVGGFRGVLALGVGSGVGWGAGGCEMRAQPR